MKRTKEQGITLIALVITIIVLLILAGVALATLTGNSSIIDNANYAVTEYNKSANSDQNVLNQVENLFAKYMGGSSTGDDDDDDNVIGNLASTVQVGDYITYDPTLGVTNSSLLSYTSPVGELKVKKTQNGSEYVVNEAGTETYEYDGAYNLLNVDGEFEIPQNSNYYLESNVSGNGYGEQSFIATASNNLWRVLYANTTTGVIKIVPEVPILRVDEYDDYGLDLKGLRGYINTTTELDNISAIFGYGKGANGAQSITIDDVDDLLGYTDVSRTLTEISMDNVDKEWYDVRRYSSGNVNLEPNIESMLYKSDYYYWIASNNVMFGVDFVDFSANFIDFDIDTGSLFRVYDSGDMFAESGYNGSIYGPYCVMPVVTLKASENFLGGTGTQATPWIFQAVE